LELCKIFGGIGYFSAKFIAFGDNPEANIRNVGLMKIIDFLSTRITQGHFIDMRYHNIDYFVQGASVVDLAIADNDFLAFK
jgi:hypothetical protein